MKHLPANSSLGGTANPLKCCSLSGALSGPQLSRNSHCWLFEISASSPHPAPRLGRGGARCFHLVLSGTRHDPCLCSTATKPDTAPSHSRALSPRKRVREGVAQMSSSLSLTMSVSGPQNRRLFCGTCRRWGRRGSQVTPGLGHLKTSCSGSPGMGKRFSVFRKGKHCRANYGHILPPPSWCHFSYKLFLQATGLWRDAKDQ